MEPPDMRAHVRSLLGQTLHTAARDRPNRIVAVTPNQAIVETADGSRNPASLRELQELANRVYAGDEVPLPVRGRSAFHMAVLISRPEIEYALDPRRVWLRDPDNAFDAEYADLFPDEDPVRAREGRVRYREHRVRERSPALRRLKKEQVLLATGRLGCEVCDVDFVERYGALGKEFIECHHVTPLAEGQERETTTDDLVVLCANCHRMIHRSKPMLSPPELRERLR